jgi:hypothetical protein
MPHPLETLDSFYAPIRQAEIELERTRHRQDANRHMDETPDPRDEVQRLRETIEAARMYLSEGIGNPEMWLNVICDCEEELAALGEDLA